MDDIAKQALALAKIPTFALIGALTANIAQSCLANISADAGAAGAGEFLHSIVIGIGHKKT